MEEKFDGDRFLMVYTDQSVKAYTRQGTEAVVPRIKTARHTLEFLPFSDKHKGTTVIDGEIMGDGQYHVFDIPIFQEAATGALTYTKRRAILERLPLWKQSGFNLVESVTDPAAKEAKLKAITENGLEGVVFKHVDSTYRFDFRSTLWLKWKLTKTLSAFITEVHREGKPEAFTICVYDGENLHELSGCKIPSRYQSEYDIRLGDVIEVRYLSVSDDDKLIQPVFVTKRRDISPFECTKEQLHEC